LENILSLKEEEEKKIVQKINNMNMVRHFYSSLGRLKGKSGAE